MFVIFNVNVHSLGGVLFCFFFFFKQKTAYEMRISDWSSDVCSSDLIPCPRTAAASGSSRSTATRRRTAAEPYRPHHDDRRAGEGRPADAGRCRCPAHPRGRSLAIGRRPGHDESGRASLRARACPSVEITEVALVLKKKINNSQ